MPVLETLRQALPELSKSERRAADYLLQYPNDMRRMTCDAIAAASGSSRSAWSPWPSGYQAWMAMHSFCKKALYSFSWE